MAAAPPLVLLHGFTQTGVSWRPVIEALESIEGSPEQVRAIDLPGHGDAAEVRLDLAGMADRLAGQIAERGGPALVVGYSMGGRVALRLALDHPDAVAGLALIGATAGIDDPSERAARRAADERLAARIEAEGAERPGGLDAFLEDWLAQPLFGGLVAASDDLAARRANSPAGLASSLRLAGTGTMDPPWWDELHRITVPTLVIWGERDPKFAVLGQRLATGIGSEAQTAEIAEAGHAAHLERPLDVAAEIARFAAGIRR